MGKLFILVLTFGILQMPVMSQKPLPEWFRVYTFEDSIIELNTKYVVFSDRKIERVRFRWSFQTPQTLNDKSKTEYQSILQEIQFDCRQEKFRLYSAQWLDSKGKPVAGENKEESEEFQEIKFGSMMHKLIAPACKLIELRKREPVSEK